MNPSHDDENYQLSLARRGAFIEYDMIGMDYFYADQQVQCPSDDDAAQGILRLAEHGYLESLLLSQDVFLKMMLTPLWRQRLCIRIATFSAAFEKIRYE